MTTISLICPKCGKNLHTEDEGRYYSNFHGCTIHCTNCNLSLIGVDLSVCAKCPTYKREGHKCDTKYVTLVMSEGKLI